MTFHRCRFSFWRSLKTKFLLFNLEPFLICNADVLTILPIGHG